MTDQELLAQYVDHADSQAFAQLVERHAGMVRAIARRLAPADADDVAQAAFLVLLQKAPTLRDRTDLAAWLHRVTTYCAANARRTERRRDYHERHYPMPTPDPGADHDLQEQLDNAVARLKEPYRAVVLLRYSQGLNVEQVSQRLGLSPAAVTKRSERAIGRLRELLAASGTSCSTASLLTALAQDEASPPAADLIQRLAHPTAHATAMAQAASSSLSLGAAKAGMALSVPIILLTMAAAVVVATQLRSPATNQSANAASSAVPQPDLKPSTPMETWINTLGMRFVRIPAGRFTMGSPLTPQQGIARYGGDPSYYTTSPQREVEIPQPFLMGIYPVTRAQFALFVSDTNYRTTADVRGTACGLGVGGWRDEKGWSWRNPGIPQTDDHPVVSISWDDAQAFCVWLSKKDGRTYRLPSEEQWEYACRAGTRTEFYFGDDPALAHQYANLFGDLTLRWMNGAKDLQPGPAGQDDGYATTAPVGSFPPNPWGLYDMCGNAGQWCSDILVLPNEPAPTGDDLPRVVRGGAWYLEAARARSAYRYGAAASHACNDVTFRLVTD